jgi:uncharacterized OB-fold protein
MNYHDFGITREQRDVLQADIASLRPYILAIKTQELGELRCEDCGQSEAPLRLLCKGCHDKLRDNSGDESFAPCYAT